MLRKILSSLLLFITFGSNAANWHYENSENCALLEGTGTSLLSVCIPISEGFIWATDLEIQVQTESEVTKKSLATKVIELNGTRLKAIYFLPTYQNYNGAFSIESKEGKKFVMGEIAKEKSMSFYFEDYKMTFLGSEFQDVYEKVLNKYKFELQKEKQAKEEQSDAL